MWVVRVLDWKGKCVYDSFGRNKRKKVVEGIQTKYDKKEELKQQF